MCGICGYIGRSKSPKITFELTTRLFEQSESRGKDAAGFWGVEAENGKILYHKEPCESGKLVQKPIWNKIIQLNPDILLLHARDATPGVGVASDNKNNHPFVNSDYSVALIHNGRIPEFEYSLLTKKYKVISTCDSEILLRIFESGKNYNESEIDTELLKDGNNLASRLMGIRDIWSSISVGSRRSMAVAIGERLSEGHRRLWLFRNCLRTLWLIDLREALGQYFFVSTDDIWQEAIQSLPNVQEYLKKSKKMMIEMPANEVWALEINPQEPIVTDDNFHRYSIEKEGTHEWQEEDEMVKIPMEKPVTDIIGFEDDLFNISQADIWHLLERCQSIQQNGVELEGWIDKNGGQLSITEYDDALRQLEQIDIDLRSLLRKLEQ
jgi:hypothetical protein